MQGNFYRIANGWSWKLPYVDIGKASVFKLSTGTGQVFDLPSLLTDANWETVEKWVESYHVIIGAESSGKRTFQIAIPEAQLIIKCTVAQSGASTPYTYTIDTAEDFYVYLADGTRLEFNADGYLYQIQDAAAKNTITYTYEDPNSSGDVGALNGTVSAVTDNRTFTIQADDYDDLLEGDLITIDEETRVVFLKDGSNVITVSGGFDVTPAVNDAYKIHKGQLEQIAHSNGHYVKFYYYKDSGESEAYMTILLSSDGTMDNFAEGDKFLEKWTFDISDADQKVLTTIEACSDKEHASVTDGFENDLDPAGDDLESDFFEAMQGVSYGYTITATPDSDTDYIVVTNDAGATTTYYFQEGRYRTHVYGAVRISSGKVRKGSDEYILKIDDPSFKIDSGDYVNVSRIETFEDPREVSYTYTGEKRRSAFFYSGCSGTRTRKRPTRSAAIT